MTWFDEMREQEKPTVGPVPEQVRGFQVRLDLDDAKPPIWRRLALPGDVTLDDLHDIVQIAMGWENSHLHCFRTGRDRRSPHFLTYFDLDEGEEGVPEHEVRIDQVFAAKGDELWYEYDFGDSWDHRIKVEEVLDTPPQRPSCLTGRRACPPEDCGGWWGYEELASWVLSGYKAGRPGMFPDDEDTREWLAGWHPDHVDIEKINAALGRAYR